MERVCKPRKYLTWKKKLKKTPTGSDLQSVPELNLRKTPITTPIAIFIMLWHLGKLQVDYTYDPA
jgi:hypothetical protein